MALSLSSPRSNGARLLLVAVGVAFAVMAATASSALAAKLPGANIAMKSFTQAADYPGIQHLHYEYGPISITPGQNTIEIRANQLKPDVPGYITRFKPDLIYAKTRKVPRVDVIHLHHGVWIMNGYPTFAAGEEKTIFDAPQGYGYHYNKTDFWLMNYMIHNLTPTPTKVFITYDIDFVPDSTEAAKTITPIKPMWMDVAGIKAYPVFDAHKGTGSRGKYTFPNQARGAAKAAIGPAHSWTVGHDVTLVGTAGHLHPGGLYDDLNATRAGTTTHLFRSVAKYFEPAGAVSWDVSMTATKPDWRVALKQGDTVNVSATYDTSQASWYEVMGIMVVWYADGVQPGAKDPFTDPVDWHGILTHGHLAENNNHGGAALSGLPDATSMLSGPPTNNVDIRNFVYGRGDLTLTGPNGRPPTVRAGQSITFKNLDSLPGQPAATSVYHTITACRQPCNGTTGIAYPRANANVQFDSKELGFGPAGFTPASNRQTWKTPRSLHAGTYTFFCRIHPFMRGSFRVITARKR
jgi:plastocyanin